MGADQLQALAHEIASQAIQHTWGYWLILVALLLVANFTGSLIGSYAAKRGEHLAIDADLRRILRQLDQTTRLTENIRSVVSLGEWSERERRTLRRTKLEELLLNAHKTGDWLNSERNRLIFLSGEPELPSPQPLMVMLGRLYFPDLQQQIHDFDSACDQYLLKLFAIQQDIFQAKMDATAAAYAQYHGAPGWETAAAAATLEAQNAVRERRNPELQNVHRVAIEALPVLDGAAAAVMATIVDARAGAETAQQ